MGNIVYLGIIGSLLDELNMDDFEAVLEDGRVFIKEDIWAFAMKEDLESLEEKFSGINMENEDIVNWACYAASDFRLHSMENLKFDDLVEHKEFSSTIAEKVKELSKEDIENLNIEKLTVTTVKELIILNLKRHVVELAEEMKREVIT